MRRSLLLAALAILAPLSAAAQEVARVDPWLRMTRVLAPSPTDPEQRPALPGLAAVLRAERGREVAILARVGPGGEAAIETRGGRIGARVGGIVTARVPLEALGELLSDPALAFLESGSRLSSQSRLPRPGARRTSAFRLSLASDLSTEDAGAHRLRVRVGQGFTGTAGQGVIVGVYDSGLDLDHRDFLVDALGRSGSRVLYAWDQTLEPGEGHTSPGPVGSHTFDYGVECSAVAGTLPGCPMTDMWGHGTHVAGIAAADGSATGNGMPPFRYTGMAPAADLIIVKGGDQIFTRDRVLDGVAYIFARAAELGRPAVVNLSLGGASGPHDGTTLFEQALDSLVGPGRILVTIAGNVGTNANESPAFFRAPSHAQGTLGPGGAGEHVLIVPSYTPAPGDSNDLAGLELWYDGLDSLDLVITTPGGDSVRIASGDTARAELSEGSLLVDNASEGPQAINGDRVAIMVLADLEESRPPAAGEWRIRVEGAGVRGTGHYHLWLLGGTFANVTSRTRLQGGTANSHLVTSPGTARRAITVAAHVTRHEWPGMGGRSEDFAVKEPLGDIAFFSSPGPSRDGRLKPELSAPGKMVVSSAVPNGGAWRTLPSLLETDGQHVALLGTSMAAPHVAGTVALLLQHRPLLTPEEARTLLIAGARSDAFTRRPHTGEPDGLPNAQWGHGKLDAEAAVRGLGLPAGAVALTAEALALPDAPIEPLTGSRHPLLALEFTVAEAEPVVVRGLTVHVAADDTAGAAVMGLDFDGDGRLGEDEPVLRRTPLGRDAAGGVLAAPPEVVLPPGRATRVLVAFEPGGGLRHGGTFSARFDPAGLTASGVLSGVVLSAGGPTQVVHSGAQPAGLLRGAERLNLSANPVRGDELVVSWTEAPETAAVYALGGRRVRSLTDAIGGGHLAWDLTDDEGRPLANGAYFLVLDYAGRRVLEKVLLLRP